MADCLRGCEKRQSSAASSCGCFQASTEPKDHQVAGACARGGTAMTSKGGRGRNRWMPALFAACARCLSTDRALKGFKLLSVPARGIRMGVSELSELPPHRILGDSGLSSTEEGNSVFETWCYCLIVSQPDRGTLQAQQPVDCCGRSSAALTLPAPPFQRPLTAC